MTLGIFIASTPEQRATLERYERNHIVVGDPTMVAGEVAFTWRHANDTLGWMTHSRIRFNGIAYIDSKPPTYTAEEKSRWL